MSTTPFNLIDLVTTPYRSQGIPIRGHSPTVQRLSQPFIHLNVDLHWIKRVTRIGGKAPSVAFALLFLAGVNKSESFPLTKKVIEIACCERKALYRALAQMESEGLIAISRRQGRKPIVQLLGYGRNVGKITRARNNSILDMVPEV
jgi:hypothetical protein